MKTYDEALREINAKLAEREKAYLAYIESLRPAAEKLAAGVDGLVERDVWEPAGGVGPANSERHRTQRLFDAGQTREMAQLVCSILHKAGYETDIGENGDAPRGQGWIVFVVDPLRKKPVR